MNTQLKQVHESLRRNAERAQSLASGTGAERFCLRPSPRSWSAAECIAHLTLATEMSLPFLQHALEEARARRLAESGPFKMDFVGGAFVWILEPPARIRVKAPPILQPGATVNDALPAFLASQEKLLAIIDRSNGLAIDRIKLPSPVNSRIRFSVWSSFNIADAHQRRHLAQAERAVGLSK
jgi:hypothetical protein